MWRELNLFINSRGLSTQNGYKGAIREYMTFLGGNYDEGEGEGLFLDATVETVSKYIDYARNKRGKNPRSYSTDLKASPGTIGYKIRALSRMYDVIIGGGSAILNPFKDHRFDKFRRARVTRPTEMVQFDKVKRLILSPPKEHPSGIRDRAILACLFGGALRRSEVAKLRVGDYRLTESKQPYLYLRETKSGGDARQAIPQWAGALLEEHVMIRHKHGARDSDPMFVSHWGASFDGHGVYMLFKRWALACGLGNEITPHSARATAITKLLKNPKIPMVDIQEYARHRSIQTTVRYNKLKTLLEDSPAKLLDY